DRQDDDGDHHAEQHADPATRGGDHGRRSSAGWDVERRHGTLPPTNGRKKTLTDPFEPVTLATTHERFIPVPGASSQIGEHPHTGARRTPCALGPGGFCVLR